jgi:hypothetical protein
MWTAAAGDFDPANVRSDGGGAFSSRPLPPATARRPLCVQRQAIHTFCIVTQRWRIRRQPVISVRYLRT